MSPRSVLIVLTILGLSASASAAGPNFQTEIQPILSKCVACHGADDASRMGNLRLDTFEGATGAAGGAVGIVPGDSAASRVLARVTHPANPMPPGGERLTDSEIELLKQWIDAGASYSRHWAFVRPERSELPGIANPDWARNPIDRFVAARLDQEGLQPSPEADRYTLIRRLSLDLTGLPPSLEDAEAFAADESPDAYERLVDRLLNSPAYGERWARVWLDLARYADSMGYEKDSLRSIWPYRDWVVKALNNNMPFDRFTILQLAGDLLPVPTQDQLVATGFHRNTMTNTEGGTDDEEFRDAALKDRVATTGQVWMGQSWGCAQCHSHKYDPLTQKEFYQVYAFYNQTADADQNDDAPTLSLGEDVSTLIFRELPPDKHRKTHVQNRGNFMDLAEEVTAEIPAAFNPWPADAPKNRLGLAKWLVSKENPLTARVTVNRLWARLFGAGIVSTEEDFGTQGSAPTHTELLDWLATEFMRLDWDVKGILKTMVMSATYRQNSDVSPELLERDPRNELLARGARFRLPAEVIRDQALEVSGLLSHKIGGEPVMPWQPEGVWQVVYSSMQWETSPGEDRYRRALYTTWRRTSPYPSMTTFDAPSGEVCTLRRIRTNTPLQALVTLNDPTLMEAAQKLAQRALADAKETDKARAERIFRLAAIRPPTEPELERLVALHGEAADDLRDKQIQALKLTHYDQMLYTSDRRLKLLKDNRDGDGGARWRYTAADPGKGWENRKFDDSSWESGLGGFGYSGTNDEGEERKPADWVQSPWKTENLWMRTSFELSQDDLSEFQIEARFSGSFEIYVNGVHALSGRDGSGTYAPQDLNPAALKTLKPGKNIIAVQAIHTGLTDAGRNIDVGLTALAAPSFEGSTDDAADRAAWVVVANVVLNLDETLTRR